MKTPAIRKNVELDSFIVMPNHIHGIIIIHEPDRGELHSPHNDLHPPQNEKSDKSYPGECNIYEHHFGQRKQGECNSPLRSPSHTIGAIVRGYKSSVTKKINFLWHETGVSIWQRNYYEHIIRDERSYQNIAKYIIGNPAKWRDDKLF